MSVRSPRVLLVVMALCARAPLAAIPVEPPGSAAVARYTDAERGHWAYRPITHPTVPAATGARNPIDAFVRRALARNGLEPSRRASRETLLRRAKLDLHGLPPAPDDVAAFAGDDRPGAWERFVDRLLASPRYGERWGRHWLDAVRYAESDGFKSDVYRRGAWRYRDYVIRALNRDKSYARFVEEQLAGDEIDPLDGDALVATGFLRHWAYEDNGRDLDRAWTAILGDVTDVTGQVFLGLSVGCARCHDHKFDAIRQADYYRLQAFFAAMAPRDDLAAGTDAEIAEYHAALSTWERATRELRAERDRLQATAFQREQRSLAAKFPPFVKEILDRPESERTIYERQLVHLAGKQLGVEPKRMAKRMSADVRERWDSLNAAIAEFDDMKPRTLPLARGVRDIGPEAPPIRVPGADGDPLDPGFPGVFGAGPIIVESPRGNPESTGRRTALARWLTSRGNPLTARVIVNRVWMHHFGRGLVATPADFGVRGARPSHPELLDWLAFELRDRDWSLKWLHRLIMTSETYQQRAVVAEGARGLAVDPENRFIWRMSSRRLEAEVMRDSMLAASGDLNLRMGGESVFPKLPKGLTGRYGWKATESEIARRRRSVYLAVKRNMQLPLLKTFDLPDNHFSCSERDRTTTPTQALTLLNDEWVLERGRHLAARVRRDAGDANPARWVDTAYRIVFSRAPNERERLLGTEFLVRQRRGDVVSALADYCHALLNTNEFVYVD